MDMITDFLSSLPEGVTQLLSVIAIGFAVAIWLLGKILTKIAQFILLIGLGGLGYNLYSTDMNLSEFWEKIQEKGIIATMFEEEKIELPPINKMMTNEDNEAE